MWVRAFDISDQALAANSYINLFSTYGLLSLCPLWALGIASRGMLDMKTDTVDDKYNAIELLSKNACVTQI